MATTWDHDLWLRFRNGPPVESLDWRLLIDEIQELREETKSLSDRDDLEEEIESLETELRYKNEQIEELEAQVAALKGAADFADVTA